MTQRIAACILTLTTSVSLSFGQSLTKTGTSAAAFLKIAVGPRAVAMGGAFTATANDVSAMYWNPGGLATVYANEAYFNHVSWFADVRYDFAGFSSHLSDFGTVGVFVSVLGMDDMQVRTLEMPEGTGEFFTAGGLMVGLSYARSLTDAFAIGFNAKYIREYIWNSAATGFAMDAGVIYRIPVLNELRLAASIANFGSKMRLEGRDNLLIRQVGGTEGNLINTNVELDRFDLPLLFRVGVAADVVRSEEFRVTTAVDAVHPNDNTEYLNSGIEVAWQELVFLRGGVKSLFERDTEQGLTAGVGLNYRVLGSVMVKVDYAYQDFGRLTNIHTISLGVRF